MLVFEWYVKTCQLKKSSRSCTSFHASEGRFQNCVVFCVHKTCVNKACVKKACVKKAYVKRKINLRAKNAGSCVKVEGCSPFSALARLRHARENLEKTCKWKYNNNFLPIYVGRQKLDSGNPA